ncbi:hypothetical protein [Soonwooa sp.]|uniref:LIC_10190 family membrane protein n=1 Tax=Soonwooa sp. TaxID=1938592 RepID=UPI0026126031|nr:hypothetical protein [Soonwooa sp.]
MLYLLLTTTLLFIITYGLGNLYQKLLPFYEEKISTTILIGLSITAIIWTAIAFFFPINKFVEITFSALGILSFIYFKSYHRCRSFLKRQSRFFYFCLVTIVLVGCYYPFILDHFGYYVPTIKWIQEYGLVKGISNLDMLLGQYSPWHILQTGFSNFVDPYLRLNTFLLFVFLIYVFETRAWIGLLFMPIFFLFAQSPSPDLPTLVLSFIIVKEVLNQSRHAKFLLMLSCFAFSIKPTSFWLVIFCFIYFWLIKRNKLLALLPAVCFLSIYLIKNIWVFGHPFFPIGFPDLGLAWQPNYQLLELSKQTSTELSYDLEYKYQEIQKFSCADYIINWINLDGIKGVIHKLFVLTLIVLGVFAFLKKKKIISLLVICIFIKSFLILVFSAQYRLFLDVFLVTGILLFSKTWYPFAKLGFVGLSAIILVFLTFPKSLQSSIPSFNLGNMMMGWEKLQFLRPANFNLNKYKTYQIGNLKFNIVKDYPFSFDTALPAISPDYLRDYEKVGVFPQKIGQDLKNGFIWKKMTPAEHQELQRIIKEVYP